MTIKWIGNAGVILHIQGVAFEGQLSLILTGPAAEQLVKMNNSLGEKVSLVKSGIIISHPSLENQQTPAIPFNTGIKTDFVDSDADSNVE